MWQQAIVNALSEYAEQLSFLPQILWYFKIATAVSAIFFGVLVWWTWNRPPQEIEPPPRAPVISENVETSAIQALVAAVVLYITWQYVVHGEIFLSSACALAIFSFFGALFSLLARFQMVGQVTMIQGIWGGAKILSAIMALAIALYLLLLSERHRQSIPESVRYLDFFPFCAFFIKGIFLDPDAFWYLVQQALGVTARYVVIISGLRITLKYIAVRFPPFCEEHPYIFRVVSRSDGALPTIFLLVLSFASNDLLKGELVLHMQGFGHALYRLFFTV